jgi:hypothetical protein
LKIHFSAEKTANAEISANAEKTAENQFFQPLFARLAFVHFCSLSINA